MVLDLQAVVQTLMALVDGAMSEGLKKYRVYELVSLENRSIYDIPAPGAEVYLAADVEPILNDCAGMMKELVQVITNALPQIKGALIRQDCELAITEAQRLLAEWEGKT